MYIGFHIPFFSPSSLSFGFFLVNHLFKVSVQTISDSNLQSLFYNVIYDAASTINYSKEPMDIGVVESPYATNLRLLPSPLPLKRGHIVHVIVARTPTLGPASTCRLTSGFKWTFGQHRMCPSMFLPMAHCPPMPTPPRPSHISMYIIAYAKVALHFLCYFCLS